MKSGAEAQRAHDELLANKPAGVEHEPCQLCPDPVIETKEVAKVAGDDRTYSEVEHIALMADAVTRETAELSTAKESAETKVTDLTGRVDVLEAEKAALSTEKDKVQADFDTYKTEVERAREIETAKHDRLEKVKAANGSLPDSYFTDERVQRWAEMGEAQFASFVEDITPLGGVTATKETAAFSGGTTPSSDKTHKASVASLLGHGRKI